MRRRAGRSLLPRFVIAGVPLLRRVAVPALILLVGSGLLSPPVMAQTAAPCGSRKASFEFKQLLENKAYPTLSPQQQARFKKRFCEEVTKVEQLFGPPANDGAVHLGWWLPAPDQPIRFLGQPDPYVALRGAFDGPFPDLQVIVSDDFHVSESLVPAALGHRGKMTFPAYEAALDQSAIDHELTHVFFPNGNRMLAEGLAIYVQDLINANPGFPNYGTPLNGVVRDVSCRLGLGDLSTTDLVGELDKVATPSPLLFHIGLKNDELAPDTYPIAGSFVTFLIEKYGADLFHKLYTLTPLVPLERDEGDPERWRSVYNRSLADLEAEWRAQFSGLTCHP